VKTQTFLATASWTMKAGWIFIAAHRLLLSLLLLVIFRPANAAPSLDLDITLDPATRQFKAQATLQPETRDFRFSLYESLQIVGASADGKTLRAERLTRRNGSNEWRIKLPETARKLLINYEGTLPALERTRDHRQVLHRLSPMAAPEGSFLPAGSGWYPEQSQQASLFTYRLHLSVPSDQRALVPGRLVSETLPAGNNDRYRASFEVQQPTDGIDLMAGPWVVREKMAERQGQKSAQKIRLRTYFPADLDAESGLAQAYLDDSARYLERYSKAIGDYPYSEFSVVASPLPTGFGMPTLTYIGAAVLRLPFIRKTSLGHEILHNWWGNGVYVDYAQGNWCEGLTTFMADYAYKEDESATAAREMRLSWLRDAAALPAADQPALRDFRSRTHGAEAAIGYGKAAMVFSMLRDRIGETAFRQGLRDFWVKQQFRVASWQDLRLAFERASGESLTDFFALWLDTPALPQIAIEALSSQPVGKRYRLSITTTQSVQGKSLMKLRVPVEISAPGHSEIRWIDINDSRQVLQTEVSFRPQQLRLDPDLRVWRRLDASQLPPILRRWIGAKAPLIVNAAKNSEARTAIEQLAQRFFETTPKPIGVSDLAQAIKGEAPILLAGSHAEVAAILQAAGLPPRPAQLEQSKRRGTAQVWTSNQDHASPLAIISADDAAALLALQRGLPHYGGKSWLIFEGSQAIEHGVWPAAGRALNFFDEKIR
jgi:hypothetical protein